MSLDIRGDPKQTLEPLQQFEIWATVRATGKVTQGIDFDIKILPPECGSSSGTSTSQSIGNARGSSKRRSPESVCYDKLLRENGPSLGRKSRKTVPVESRVCYGKVLRDLPRGVLRRGQKLYYRHTVPVAAQRLLNRLEIWRSLRTDSLAVAMRRLPSVVARIEMEIEHARAMAGLPVDATLIQPSNDDPPERVIEIAPLHSDPWVFYSVDPYEAARFVLSRWPADPIARQRAASDRIGSLAALCHVHGMPAQLTMLGLLRDHSDFPVIERPDEWGGRYRFDLALAAAFTLSVWHDRRRKA